MIKPYFETDNGKLYHGGALNILERMSDESVNCVVTSPPYWGLRDYSTAGQIGLESTIQEYIEIMIEIFIEVMRVLAIDGTLWLNMGDSYAGGWRGGNSSIHKNEYSKHGLCGIVPVGLKPKDLIGMPWRIAFVLQAEGWYLRSDIIWHKPNPMPESVTDRPTKSHEYIFLMSKSSQYYYDYESIKEPAKESSLKRLSQDIENQKGSYRIPGKTNGPMKAVGLKKTDKQRGHGRRHAGFNDRWDSMTKDEQCGLGSNKRTVWTVPTMPYSEAHFATYPVNLIYPCIKAGCPVNGVVLDPFMGSGTTAIVAERLNRKWAGIEINQDYCNIAVDRIKKETAQYKMDLTYSDGGKQ